MKTQVPRSRMRHGPPGRLRSAGAAAGHERPHNPISAAQEDRLSMTEGKGARPRGRKTGPGTPGSASLPTPTMSQGLRRLRAAPGDPTTLRTGHASRDTHHSPPGCLLALTRAGGHRGLRRSGPPVRTSMRAFHCPRPGAGSQRAVPTSTHCIPW